MPNGEQPLDYDVFISYSHRDQEWVRGELLPRIEQVGLRAFIDFRDFRPGAPSLNEMERGVRDCRHTLLVLTPAYLASGWCELENLMLQTLDPANRELRLLPLLKVECEKPLRIGTLTHIDFTAGADVNLAWKKLFVALGRAPVAEAPTPPERIGWRLVHPYPMPPHFTGRVDEQRMLSAWLNDDAEHPLLVLRALGGFGKSALVWHWLNHAVDPARWPKVVWWSFYEGEAGFERFLAAALAYLDDQPVPERVSVLEVRRLVERLRAGRVLLVLDGFERELRAFGGMDAAYRGDGAAAVADPDRDCLSLLAEKFLLGVAAQEPKLRGKVLLTTRLCPRILERHGGLLAGVREEALPELSAADAVAWFWAEGIRGTRAEIEDAGRPYGFHALSLRLLVGLILNDLRQPGDIAVAGRLDVSGDLVQCQHHVLQVAYERLAPARRALLGRIACFRGPVKYEALVALAKLENDPASLTSTGGSPPLEKGEQGGFVAEAATDGKKSPLAPLLQRGEQAAATLEGDLRDLIGRGLLHHDKKAARFDLHPIVRRYAYDRLAEPERIAAHGRLRDYFAAVPKPERVTCLDDLAPVIELYHHMVRAGQFDEARVLFRDSIAEITFYQFGAYGLQIELLRMLFPDGEHLPPRLAEESAQAWVLNVLANSCGLSGQPRRSVPLYEQSNYLVEKNSDNINIAISLVAISSGALIQIGMFQSAELHLRRSINICSEDNDGEFWKAASHVELGRLLSYRNCHDDAAAGLSISLDILQQQHETQYECVAWSYRTLLCLNQHRSKFVNFISPFAILDSARHALYLADETARIQHPYERDYVRAHWLLGAAHRVAENLDEAAKHLHEALERCRRISLVEMEADILIDLARLHAATGHPTEALRLADEARHLAERCGYVLQGADAHLELAKLHLATDRPAARHHAEEAKRLATCDGPPDYTYHAAYQEALGLLRQLEPT